MSDHTPSQQDALEARVEELLGQLTLEEKVALLSGRDAWHTVPIERLGIPPLAMTDGPHGVRANRTGKERMQGPATSFPTGVSMASSWDPDLIYRVGVALAEETRALGCDILLAPCVNIVRTPLAGRNFESYSEDPYLAGRIAVAYVQGVQSGNVGTSVKHYACNNQEHERSRGSSQLDERTLREIYLPAFEAAVKEGKPWTVMCAYNRINGVYASQHNHLLNEILKEEWGFDGFVVSDWGANHTIFESVAGGLDLEMPGPAKYYGDLLVQAVRNWQVEESVVDEAARRILRVLGRSGKLDGPDSLPVGAVNTPEHCTLARELAEASMVLLKNEGGTLPLDGPHLRKVAVIGPNAAEARIGGGGSSYLEPPYRVSPLEGLRAKLGAHVDVTYEQGCDNYVELPVLNPEYLTPTQGEGMGLWGTYYGTPQFSGTPQTQRLDAELGFWHLDLPSEITGDAFSVRWEGTLCVPEGGRYGFSLATSGSCRLYVSGELIGDVQRDPQAPSRWVNATEVVYRELDAGRDYPIRVEYVHPADVRRRILYVQFAYAPEPDVRPQRAAQLAAQSDVAIVFAGMPRGFESEGRDRPHMRLPGPQDELIRAVARANERTIVVLNCGAPVEMPWFDQVSAVMLAYYPGQEGGNAVANLLLGHADPSGRLSVTHPKRYEDNPTYISYPGTREVHYGEGVFVGYRYYDQVGAEPLFPFGFGLSYTTFSYSEFEVPAEAKAGDPVEVSIAVENTGDRVGKEVVQLYVRDVESSLARPPKELKGFAKVSLQPGERTIVHFTLDRSAFSFYDPQQQGWVIEPGTFELLVGASSRDIRATATLRLID